MKSARNIRPTPGGDPSSQRQPSSAAPDPSIRRNWRDEVGHTGIYPAAGPYPPGPAEVKPAGQLGDGSYEESGRSELVYDHGQVLGGLEEPAEEPTRPQEQPEEWRRAVDQFFSAHECCRLRISVEQNGHTLTTVENRSLRRMRFDHQGQEVSIGIGDGPETLEHVVTQLDSVRLLPEGSLRLSTAEGTDTTLRCLDAHRHPKAA
jgi:hypothetical protein